MSKQEAQAVEITSQIYNIIELFLSPALLMLVLGALGHQIHNDFLMYISYWNAVLFELAVGLAWPISTQRLYLKKIVEHL